MSQQDLKTLSGELAVERWSKCLGIIKESVNSQKFSAWFEPIKPLRMEGNTLTIQVPSQFWYEWLEEHYYSIIRTTIKTVLGKDGKLQYSIKVDNTPDSYQGNYNSVNLPQRPSPSEYGGQNSVNSMPTYPAGQIQNPFVIPGIQKRSLNSNLNSNYVFERFIEGDCNRLARSAGIAIAEKPGNNSFNPFFIYGGTGLGKTHLTQSIGNQIRRDFRGEKNILYTTSDDFTNEFVQAIRNNRANEFSMLYRSIDVLIIDDIQFFSGKEKTQEEFFHIFNALHQEGKQIILTSDRAPKDIPDIEERLISRFNWGLAADLQMPDYETRYAILERKAMDNGIEFDPKIFEFIATNFKSNVRDLEGAIIKLLAASSLQHLDVIDLPTAKRILKDMIKDTNKQITVENIQSLVCEYFGIDTNKVREKTRKQEIVEARQIAMYLAKKLTKSSLKSIGLQFGGRDHSTVIHAITTIEDRLQTSTRHVQIIKDLQQKIELASL
ncbi:MAG: chromosomal replication initiator protein DnaA [Balneolales bacterium]|nr:chromosomal replication initiator protein DnaA [Balneolales bacterium]